MKLPAVGNLTALIADFIRASPRLKELPDIGQSRVSNVVQRFGRQERLV